MLVDTLPTITTKYCDPNPFTKQSRVDRSFKNQCQYIFVNPMAPLYGPTKLVGGQMTTIRCQMLVYSLKTNGTKYGGLNQSTRQLNGDFEKKMSKCLSIQ